MTKEKSSAFFYETQQQAEDAIGKLEGNGFDMKLVSLVLADFSSCNAIVGYYDTENEINKMGSIGRFSGMLNQSAFFMIPGIGPLLITGAFVSAFLTALNDNPTKSFPKILSSALLSQGIPLQEARQHETTIAAGKFILFIQGSGLQKKVPVPQIEMQNRREYDKTIVLSGGEHSVLQ